KKPTPELGNPVLCCDCVNLSKHVVLCVCRGEHQMLCLKSVQSDREDETCTMDEVNVKAKALASKLDDLDTAIVDAIAKKGDITDLVHKYEKTIDKLPLEEDGIADLAMQYRKRWTAYLTEKAAIESDAMRARWVAQMRPPKDDLPKEEAIKHNGKMET